jgi:curli biogenesis system outer membrane secretion channel CsgG
MKTIENKGFLPNPNAMGRSVPFKAPVNLQITNKIKGFEHISYGTALKIFETFSRLSLALFVALGLAGCATESHQALKTEQVASAGTPYAGHRSTLMVGKFDNHSPYMRGLFSDGVDRLGGQAKSILITHMQQTGRFVVVDRDNMQEITNEATIKGQQLKLKGADYVVTGEVAEFGRKEVGDQQLFGILGSGKKQVAYSKVNLNVVDAQTSEVVYSTQGAGEYALSDREVLGFGGTSSYDSTLNGKVLDLAIREAVNRLVEGVEQGKWKPEK